MNDGMIWKNFTTLNVTKDEIKNIACDINTVKSVIFGILLLFRSNAS